MGRARRLIEAVLIWLGKWELATLPLPRILLATTSLTSDRLLRGFDHPVTPLVLARWFPNLSNPWFVLRCLYLGVVAVGGTPREILDRLRPYKVLIDGFGNEWVLEVARLARQRGIPVYAIWHGPYYQDVKKDVFASVDCVLSWGEGNEEWLEANDVRLSTTRVGNHIA